MRSYELVLVTKTSLSEALRKKLVTSIKALLKDFKISKEDEVGQKTLGYKIKKEQNGFFLDFVFEGENAVPSDLGKKLFENDNVLRHLVIRKK